MNPIASIGKANSIYNIFIGIIFSLIFLSIGIYMFFYTDTYNSTKATIISSLCENQLCKSDISYIIDKYNNTLQSNNKYEPGNTIDIYYNTNNKYDINTNKISIKIYGFLSLLL